MVDEKTIAWIKLCEGLELESYIDTTGHLSIGWGRNLENGISIDEAELMFQNDLNRTVKELQQFDWYLSQPSNVKHALINMNFNLGIKKLLSFKKMISALEDNDYTRASLEALDSLWSLQVGTRAKDVALMIRQG